MKAINGWMRKISTNTLDLTEFLGLKSSNEDDEISQEKQSIAESDHLQH